MCKCRAKMTNNQMIRTNTFTHNHCNHKSKAEYEELSEKLKAQVAESNEAVEDLHERALRQCKSTEASGRLAWISTRENLQRIRRRRMPPCSSLQQLDTLMNEND